jgi:hypothetical protein
MHGSIGNLVELLNKCINGGKYRGISRAYGIPYRRFTYRGIPFIPVYRATLIVHQFMEYGEAVGALQEFEPEIE